MTLSDMIHLRVLGFQESTMKKPVAMTLALLLCSCIFALSAGAVDAPHYDPAAGNVCGTCHTVQLTLGSTGYNNICQSCHRPGDPGAGSRPITLADAANPFGVHSTTGISKMYQTSHRWDGSDTNPAAGAEPPVQGQMTTNGLRTRTAGQLACVRCHNQHDNSNGSFLRVKNDKDQLCMDCHRSRNVQSHTQGSHPVNVVYAEKYAANPAAFNAKPLNLNPANPTSSLFARISSAGGVVLCSTCHSAHFADSRSSTADGAAQFANLSSGDGNLLRTDRRGSDPGARNDSANICSSCHAGKKSHNMKGQDIQCTDCHGAHVEYDQDDPNGSKNIYLIRRNAVTKDGHSITNKKVFFRYTGSQKEYTNGAGTGICQSCHIVPPPDSVVGYPPEHASNDPLVCNTCHFHNSANGSFSGACTACHGYPPTTANSLVGYARPADPITGATPDSPGAHETHATGRHMACITCHTGYAAKAMPSNTIDIGFSINNSTYKNFVGTVSGGTFNGTPLNTGYAWSTSNGTSFSADNTAITCSVYCHGTTLTGGNATPPAWTKTDGSQKACGACHGVTPATAQTTGSHTRHAKDNVIACATCHGAHANNDHVNGSVEWNFGALPGNGMYRGATSGSTGVIAPSVSYGQCTNISCHSSGQAVNGTLTPLTYGSPAWGGSLTCGDCHKNMKSDATAPGSHVKHAQSAAIACAACHNGYTETSVTTSTHSNGSINLAFSGIAAGVNYSQGDTHPLGNGYGTCSTNCHSATNAPVTTPGWGTAATCASCHEAAPATGAHAKHLTVSGLSCGQCHNGAAVGSSGGASHVNGTIEVAGYSASPVAKHAVGTYTGTCSTTCHSATTTTVITPIWGATATCATCHDAAPATGTHAKHLALSGVSCDQCHNGAVAGSSGGVGHGNGTIEVTNSYSASPVAKHAAGSYAGTCSVTCHSATTAAVVTPVWGTAADCSSCHETSPTSGSHSLHLGPLFGLGCSNCHTGAQQGISAGASHYNGTVEVANSYTASPVAKHAAGTYAGTCSTTCHSPTGAVGNSPVWGDSASCGTCHAVPSVTGSHGKHLALSGVACSQCHTGAAVGVSGGGSHFDGVIDVTNSYTASPVQKHSDGIYTGTCSTVCHSATTAAGTTPVWNVASSCASCHEAVPTTGKHTVHLALSGVSCGQCHTGASPTSGGTAHYDGNISVSNAYPATAKHVAGVFSGSATCSTVCHSATTTAGTTPSWGASATCGSCHDAVPATGTHTAHLALAGVSCGQCHAGATTASGGAAHYDGTISVSNGYPVTAKHVPGVFTGSCSTSVCHGSTSPAWGANTIAVTCTKCHGKPTLTNYSTTNAWQAAPGYAQAAGSGTYTDNVSDTAPYGAHDAHIRAVNQYTTRKSLCSDCHGALPTSSSHADGLTISFSNLAKNIGTSGGNATTGPATRGTLTPVYSGGTCSAVYCHGGVMTGADTTPEWRFTGTSYLTPYAKNVTNCGKCHAALPVVAAKDHSSMTFASQNCTGCHGHEGNGSKHIDGILQASGACDGCHGYQAGSWAGATAINPEGKGAHEAHIVWLTTKRFTQTLNPATDSYAAATTAWTNVCGICHGSTAGNHTNGTVNIELGTTYQFGLSAPAYKGTPGVSSATVGSEKTCSNISCHYFTTPTWSTY